MRAAGSTALGAAFLLVAAAFDAEALYVPGLALVLLGGAAVGSVLLAARGVVVERSIGARRVVEDEPLDVRVALRARLVPLPGGELREPALAQPIALQPGRRRLRVRVRVRFARRGRRRLEAPSVLVRDPLGLVERVVTGRVGDEVLVLPRTEPVRAIAGAAGDGVAGTGRPRIAAEVDLDGLREHRPGTAASRIYWPSVARGGPMLERRLRGDGDHRPLVVLDARGPDGPHLDAAVRAAASLALELGRAGGCAVLLPGDRRPTSLDPTLAGWPQLHARLALVAPGRGPSAGAIAARRGPVLYVAAHAAERLPRALEAAAGVERWLVAPGPAGGRRPAFAVAGCQGCAVGRRRTAGAVAA